ncbi:MAG: STAS domain-containing protein [Bryobacteraceae bacterium]
MSEFKIESIPGNQDGTRILRLSGQFTLQHVFEFQGVMRSGSDPVTIIDLTGVPYMDSASLGALMGAHVFCQRNQRRYALVGVSQRLRTLFEVGGVDKLLVIYPTVEEAQLHLTASTAYPT